MQTPGLLPTHLNFDAIVFCGCTMKEMQVIAISSLTLCILVLGYAMKALINLFLVGVGLAFPVNAGLSWLAAPVFQRLKHGEPKGYIKPCR